MANHPNRSRARTHPARTPTPEEIRHIRINSELTQTEAAKLVHSTLNAWQQWEAPVGQVKHRRMHPATFELFSMKARWHRRRLLEERKAQAAPPAADG
jgi:DNA (cytosine-5)-methyltransferase 1